MNDNALEVIICMCTIQCDSISFNKVTSLVDRMSYYCLKKTSAEIELLTTLGTENDLTSDAG